MYTTQDEQRLYTQAKALLNTDGGNVEETIAQLREILNYANWKYYVENNPTLSDYEFDILFKKLQQLETEFPQYDSGSSPVMHVGSSLSSSTNTFEKVQHRVPMLSLDNTYNAQDLIDWDNRCRKLVGNEIIYYCVEPKFDGASISLLYQDNILTRAATRGDGLFGEDITNNARYINGIPIFADFNIDGIKEIELRGEVVMTKDNFKQYNQSLIARNLSPLANTRNAASGSLRLKNPEEVGNRMLEAYIYQVSYTSDGTNKSANIFERDQLDAIKYLNSKGFKTSEINKEICCFSNIQDVIDFVSKFEIERDNLAYEIDGMVIKVNNYAMQDKMGMTTHHPRWAVAYKFKARQATSKLLRVEFQVGRTGSVTPVAKIEPVPIGGVTVSSISLFNEDVVREKDLHIGDTVLVERAGDVIPYIVKPLAELRDGSEEKIIFPTHCPICNEELERPEEEAVWRCINISCPAQVVERIIHFASKDAMDIRSMGDANVRKFYELGLLPNIPGIFNINWEEVRKLDGFGEKSITNLQTAINNSKTQPLNRVIYGLGIRHVGETMAKTLANAVEHIRDLYNYTEEQLLALDDVGPKVAASVMHFFHTPENRHMIDMLDAAGVNLINQKRNTQQGSGELEGKSFLFTGTLSRFKRSEAEAMVEAKGGTLLGSVSSKLNYLVVGEDAGSKLEKAKKLGTVAILTEEEFLTLING